MSDSIHIRYAERDDIYGVAAFLHDSWQAEYRQIVKDDYLDAMSVEERHKGLLIRYDGMASEFFMMLDGEKLIGVAVFGDSFTEGYENDGEISAIYVHRDYIGVGHGRRLMSKAEAALREKGFVNLVLDLLADNERALRFYQAGGYRKTADRTIRLGENDYPLAVMRKCACNTS